MKKDSSEFHLIYIIYHTPKSDRIPTEFSSVHDKSINDALSIINEIEAGCFRAKTDVKSALRINYTNSSQWLLHVRHEMAKSYFDLSLFTDGLLFFMRYFWSL